MLRWQEGYVAVGTGDPVAGRVFPVLTSPDLVHWTSAGGALTPLPDGLGTDYWAPELAIADRRCWLYYSIGHGHTGHHLRVAVADSPLGPFTDCGLNLTPDERFAIDPHPFQDSDGTWYLFYARDVLEGERVGTQLAVAPLVGMTALAEPGRQVLAPSADWQIYERGRAMYGGVYDWHTLEGPSVREHHGAFYCVYSGGSFLGEGYSVAWARADHPLGPWTEPADVDNRLLATVPGHVRGPGHNSIVTTVGGTDMLVYHAWDETGQKRQMCVDPLEWDTRGPRTPGPSWQDRPLPR